MCNQFYNMLTIFTIDFWREDVANLIQSDQSIESFVNGPISLSIFRSATCSEEKGFQHLRKELLLLGVSFDVWICEEHKTSGIVIQGRNGSEAFADSVKSVDYDSLVKQMRCLFAPRVSLDKKLSALQTLSANLSLSEPLLIEVQMQFYLQQAQLRLSSSPLCKSCNLFVQQLINADHMKTFLESEESCDPFV